MFIAKIPALIGAAARILPSVVGTVGKAISFAETVAPFVQRFTGFDLGKYLPSEALKQAFMSPSAKPIEIKNPKRKATRKAMPKPKKKIHTNPSYNHLRVGSGGLGPQDEWNEENFNRAMEQSSNENDWDFIDES